MLKILIVDDEIMSVKTLTIMLETYIEMEKDIRGETDFHAAVKAIEAFRPDVLLLDILMGANTGFDLLAQVTNKNFSLIFITAFDQYAIKAIKHSALDYLLKPIHADELKTAFQKHIEQNNKLLTIQTEHLLNNLRSKEETYTLAIPTADKTYFIHPTELVRCESESNYTWFFLSDQTKIIASRTMKYYESLLREYDFERIHKSHLVNKTYIKAKGKGDQIILKDGTVLPTSRGKKIWL